MSASPAGAPSGPSSTTPNGGPSAMMQRRKPPVSIFTNTKKKPVKRPPPAAQRPNVAPSQAQGNREAAPEDNLGPYKDFPIVITKEAVMQGLHYHVMKLNGRPDAEGRPMNVDPYSESQFPRPVRLHRRNARDKMETADHSEAASGVDDKEKEMQSAKRAERAAEREANQALIAPTGGEAKKPQKKKMQKKVLDVFFDENNPKAKAKAQLRYEEARPWHLEDFENKNQWIGSYQEPLSQSTVLFECAEDSFKMIPVEKWYKFSQINRFEPMSVEAVEKQGAKRKEIPRWIMGTHYATEQAAALKRNQKRQAQLQAMMDDDDVKPPVQKDEYQADVDGLDYNAEDEFQDDDEGGLYVDQGEEDVKDIVKRIQEEMRGANLPGTGVKEDKDWDEEETQEQKQERERKRREKRTRKQLIKKEKKNEYDSDSDRNSLSESSDTEDSEDERERLEEEQRHEEARQAKEDKSGASTKGTNTPTGRAEKKDKSKLGASLKRPGSPDLSELSGNESTRKKAKGSNGTALANKAANGARAASPDGIKPKKARLDAGSGSDTDSSRAGKLNRKLKLKNSPPGSPLEASSVPGSRAQSPNRGSSKLASFPTAEEVRSAIPADGIGIGDLVKMFKTRVQNRQQDFIALVKKAGKQDAPSKKILPRSADGEAE